MFTAKPQVTQPLGVQTLQLRGFEKIRVRRILRIWTQNWETQCLKVDEKQPPMASLK